MTLNELIKELLTIAGSEANKAMEHHFGETKVYILDGLEWDITSVIVSPVTGDVLITPAKSGV